MEPLYQLSESWREISNASSPLLFFGSRLRRQNFNHTIPPAAQATFKMEACFLTVSDTKGCLFEKIFLIAVTFLCC